MALTLSEDKARECGAGESSGGEAGDEMDEMHWSRREVFDAETECRCCLMCYQDDEAGAQKSCKLSAWFSSVADLTPLYSRARVSMAMQ